MNIMHGHFSVSLYTSRRLRHAVFWSMSSDNDDPTENISSLKLPLLCLLLAFKKPSLIIQSLWTYWKL